MPRPLCCALFTLLAVGCASRATTSAPSGAPEAAKPLAATPTAGVPATLEQAEAELEQARRELETSTAALSVTSAPAAAAGAAPPTPQQAPRPGRDGADAAAPSKRRADDDAEEAKGAQAESRALEPSPCVTPCKAFASLVRAKDAVCRLDEPNGARCTRAESIVRDAESRIASCACER